MSNIWAHGFPSKCKSLEKSADEDGCEMQVTMFDDSKNLIIADNILKNMVLRLEEDGTATPLCMCVNRKTKQIRKFTSEEMKFLKKCDFDCDNEN
jgi:hypothetical protein